MRLYELSNEVYYGTINEAILANKDGLGAWICGRWISVPSDNTRPCCLSYEYRSLVDIL
jgi:hypothetical protein